MRDLQTHTVQEIMRSGLIWSIIIITTTIIATTTKTTTAATTTATTITDNFQWGPVNLIWLIQES